MISIYKVSEESDIAVTKGFRNHDLARRYIRQLGINGYRFSGIDRMSGHYTVTVVKEYTEVYGLI